MSERSPYDVLGVQVGATRADIKAARRRLALTLHPDHGGDEIAMREVNAAYAELLAAPPPDPGVVAEAEPAVAPFNQASFAMDVRPEHAYRFVAVAAAQLGDVWTVDDPYEIEVLLYEPNGSGLTIELEPTAGGTTVTLIPDQGRADEEPSAPWLAERMIYELRSLIARRGTRQS